MTRRESSVRLTHMDVEPSGTKGPLLSRDGNNLRISTRLPMHERVRITATQPDSILLLTP